MGVETIAPVIIIFAIILTLLAIARLAKETKRIREGFTTLPVEHLQAIETGQERYNPLTSLMNVLQNPFVGENPNANDIKEARDDIRGALAGPTSSFKKGTSSVVITGPGNPLLGSDNSKNPFKIPSDTKGMRTYAVEKCEKISSVDCSQFDNPDFKKNCGICHKIGTNSKAQAHMGGLYLDEDTITAARLKAQSMGEKHILYSPTVGTCPPGYFTMNRESCERLQRKQQCEDKKTFDIPGCAQCYTGGNFTIVDDVVLKGDLFLIISFIGDLTVTAAGDTSLTPLAQQSSSSLGDNTLSLGLVPEGTTLIIRVTSETQPASIGGYVQGTTVTGNFRLKLEQLADLDVESGNKPRFSGQLVVGGDNCIQLKPARGKKTMSLRVNIPVTFVESSEPEAQNCTGGPFLLSEASAKKLQSGTCFKPGNVAGNYSMDCLQEKFTELGCTTTGQGYPTNDSSALELNKTSNGTSRQLGEIADYIYENSIRAATGITSTGSKISLPDWNTASMFCTGQQITDACDAAQITGTMTKECLQQLWTNGGASTRTGATYSSPSNIRSLKGKKDNYCTANGILSPLDTSGGDQQTAINRGFAAGTIQDVKELYDITHRKANDNSLSDAQRMEAISDCYGVQLNSREGQHGAPVAPPNPNDAVTVKAQYVRITPSMKQPSYNRCLQISQLQVFNSSGEEVAKGKKATSASVLSSKNDPVQLELNDMNADYVYLSGIGLDQSSANDTFNDRFRRKKELDAKMISRAPLPSKAVDGNAMSRSYPDLYHDSCDTNGQNQFWMVNLEKEEDIRSLIYFNRADGFQERADGMVVQLLDKDTNIVAQKQIRGSDNKITIQFKYADTQGIPWISLA